MTGKQPCLFSEGEKQKECILFFKAMDFEGSAGFRGGKKRNKTVENRGKWNNIVVNIRGAQKEEGRSWKTGLLERNL